MRALTPPAPHPGARTNPAGGRHGPRGPSSRVAKAPNARPFRLTQWFAAIGLLATTIVSVVSSVLLSGYLVQNILHRDARVSMEFVQSIAEVQEARGYFTGERAADRNLVEFFNHIATMPHVLRANVFSVGRTIIWSSDPNLIGSTFDHNPELDGALGGRIQVSAESVGWKPEHMFLDAQAQGFVENYLPVHSQGEVIGVVEVYKSPHALQAAIDEGVRLVWLCTVGGAIFLYAMLFWLVRRADRTIQAQQTRLVESETLAALGAMASAVAHGIRNPLASIRSSAELSLAGTDPATREASEDILDEVDRLERWVRNLLAYSVPEAGEPENVRIADVLHDSLGDYDAIFRKRGIVVAWNGNPPGVEVRGDRALLTQVFNCLLTNAMEAMPEGGRIEVDVALRPGGELLRVAVRDSGPGLAPELLTDVFVPYKSTKRSGLGVGLPLAKRIVERFGGAISLANGERQGAVAHVDLVVTR